MKITIKKYRLLIIILIIFFLFFSSGYFFFGFLKKARLEGTWPFNSFRIAKIIKILPRNIYKPLKYYFYKHANPESKIISTHYYNTKFDYIKIPSISAIGRGGAINFLKKDKVLVTLDNSEMYLFDISNKNFEKINIKLQTSFLSVRDVNIVKKNKEMLILGIIETLDDCKTVKLISLNYSFENETIKFDSEKEKWSSEKVCDKMALVVHSGGRVIYQNSNYFISVGMFSPVDNSGIQKYPQDISSSLGKIIKINKENEFIVYSKGHRNPQGLFYSKKRDLLFSTEHGPRGGDELNIITKNKNYGWPCTTMGTLYAYGNSQTNIESEMYPLIDEMEGCNENQTYEDPAYTWTPAVAISQGLEYEGNHFKKFKGDLIIGSLGGKSIFRIHLSNKNQVINIERIKINERIRDIEEVNNGKILLYTDSGSLILISKH